jgi:hypothetical protein
LTHVRTRVSFVALALATIGLGLAVHGWGTGLPPPVDDVLGDALWAMMIAWWIGAALPQTRIQTRGCAALALCWAVEASQLYHAPAVDALRNTTVGHLVLGNDFEARDLAAYALGILTALLLEGAARVRS